MEIRGGIYTFRVEYDVPAAGEYFSNEAKDTLFDVHCSLVRDRNRHENTEHHSIDHARCNYAFFKREIGGSLASSLPQLKYK